MRRGRGYRRTWEERNERRVGGDIRASNRVKFAREGLESVVEGSEWG